MIAEPLNNSCHLNDSGPGTQLHGYGSLIRYGYGAVSYHHNLYADNYSRNPRPGDNIQLDFINNVVFNWGIFAGYNEDDSADNPGGYTNSLDCIGNYYIAGTNTTANPNIAFDSGVPDPTFTQIYQSGNLIDNNPFGPLNGAATGAGMFSGLYTPLGSQLVLPEISVTITNANPNIAFDSGFPYPTFTQIYQSGNLIDNNPFGPLNGAATGAGMFSGLYTPLGSQ